jgi:hypothetical protein
MGLKTTLKTMTMKKIKSADVNRMHKELQKSIFGKIPALNGKGTVYLPRVYFQKLTDEEFIVLWELKGLTIEVSRQTGDYIEKRRRMLGLPRETGSEVLPIDFIRNKFT